MRIAILGGGLAGCAAAYVLKQAGHEPVIYEAGSRLASGASGNMIGLYNPRFGAEWTTQSQYYGGAFEKALEVFPTLQNIDFNPCGALHLIMDEKKERRFSKMAEAWPVVDMEIVDAARASEIAGIDIPHGALYLPQSGSVCPAKLCAAYADGVEVHLNADTTGIEADAVILAAGPALRNFNNTKHIDLSFLDLRAVRGQVTFVKATSESEKLNCHVCYGGYVSAAMNGQHVVGSTFQRWLDHSEIMPEDDADNIEKLCAALPALQGYFEVCGQRASVRTTSRDHFPVVGQLSDNLYVSTAHGSHGILSSLMAAEIIAAEIGNKSSPVSDDVIKALSPHRFVD